MSKNRPTETQNEYDAQLDDVLFKFVSDEMDYDDSEKNIVQIVTNHTLAAMNKVREIEKSAI